MRIRIIVQYLLPLFLLLTAFQAQAVTGYKVGDMAAEFELESLDGKHVSLASLRKKGHVLLVFWAVDCVYCYAHIKLFNQAHAEYAGKLTLAAINVAGEYKSEVADYVKDNDLKYLILSDRLNNLDVAEAYHAKVTPTLVLVSPRGEVLFYGHNMPPLKRWLK